MTTRALFALTGILSALLLGEAGVHRTQEDPPAGSPQARDGTAGGMIAFTSDRDGNHEIYVMRNDGGGSGG